MKVKLTKMHFLQGAGRKYAGEIINWPADKPLSRHMVKVSDDAEPSKEQVAEERESATLSEIQKPKRGRPKGRVADEEVL